MKTIITILSIALLSSCGQRELIPYESAELRPVYQKGELITHGDKTYKVNQIYYFVEKDDCCHRGFKYRLKEVGTWFKVIPMMIEEDVIIKM